MKNRRLSNPFRKPKPKTESERTGADAVKKAAVATAVHVVGEKLAEASETALKVSREAGKYADDAVQAVTSLGGHGPVLEVVSVVGHVAGPVLAGYEAVQCAREFHELAKSTRDVIDAKNPTQMRDHLLKLGITAGETGGHLAGVFVPGVSPATTLVGFLANRLRQQHIDLQELLDARATLLPLADELTTRQQQRLPFRHPSFNEEHRHLQSLIDNMPTLRFRSAGFRQLQGEEILGEALRLAANARSTTEYLLQMPVVEGTGRVGAYVDKHGRTTLVVERERRLPGEEPITETTLWVHP